MPIELDRDIVISDDEFSIATAAIKDFSTRYSQSLDKYIDILDYVISDGISSGVIHDNLLLFKESVSTLKNEVEEFNIALSKSNEKIISEFDIADDCLF